MIPSTTSMGNLLRKSVRETAHIGSGGDLPSTALQTSPSRAAYREARLPSPEVQAALAESGLTRFRQRLETAPQPTAHSRKKGAVEHCGRRGSPRPGAG